MSLGYRLLPATVRHAYTAWQRTKKDQGAGFETGAAYGKLLREIDRARLDRDATLSCLRAHR